MPSIISLTAILEFKSIGGKAGRSSGSYSARWGARVLRKWARDGEVGRQSLAEPCAPISWWLSRQLDSRECEGEVGPQKGSGRVARLIQVQSRFSVRSDTGLSGSGTCMQASVVA